MKRLRILATALLLASCATQGPFDDVASAQHRLDQANVAFSVTRVDGYRAFVLQPHAASGANANTDVNVAAITAAPMNCTASSITRQPGGTYRVDYSC